MGSVRLGKNHLRWCSACNLPVLEERSCPSCGGATEEVRITPPADPRPAFPYDVALVRSVIDEQFGPGCGGILLPDDRIVLLNKVPSLDRMDEVIVDGVVAGSMRYDLGAGWRFIPRMYAASVLAPLMTRCKVVTDDGAVPFVLDGRNLMAPGVIDADARIEIGQEVIVVTSDDRAVCAGMARMDGSSMVSEGRGLAVKNRWYGEHVPSRPTGGQDWGMMLEANRPIIDRRVRRAVRFCHDIIAKEALPAVVSFSGGKDSLATWIVTRRAGLELPILFIDTGLEFPETISYVRSFADRYGVETIMEMDDTDSFMANVRRLGPPGRDYRWCCKTNKLGPTVRAIRDRFPDGVLSFIGQRRYESESRAAKPRVWRNPWVPGQVGASPIQDWTQMHVWMLILDEGEPYNPWYARGLDRIGCFVCPAADVGDMLPVIEGCDRYREWDAALREYADENGLPSEWMEHHLWRWKDVPKSITDELGIQRSDLYPKVDRSGERRLPEGLDVERLLELGNIIGPVSVDEGRMCIGDVVIDDGVVHGDDPGFVKVLRKAMYCVGCGMCVGTCDKGALRLEEREIRLDPSLCVHCGECMGPCPAVSFGGDVFTV